MIGVLDIRCDGESPMTLRVNTITDVSVTMTKKVTTVPIVTKGVDYTFPLETGGGMSLSFSFSRKNPDSVDDESMDPVRWSNSKWYTELVRLVNRWQMRSNGFTFIYNLMSSLESEDQGGTAGGATQEVVEYNPYISEIYERGYIKRVNTRYDSKFNEVISGSIDVSVGTAYISRDRYSPPSQVVNLGSITLLPGDLGGHTFKHTSMQVTKTLEDVFGVLTTKTVGCTFPLTSYIPDEDGNLPHSVQFRIPSAPIMWSTMANLAGLQLKEWIHGDFSFVPGTETSLELPLSEPYTLTAVWRST